MSTKLKPTGKPHSFRETDTGYIRWIDGLGRRRCKLAKSPTAPGPGTRKTRRDFLHRLMLERFREVRELGIDPKYMHAHARRRWEQEQQREMERVIVEEKTGAAPS